MQHQSIPTASHEATLSPSKAGVLALTGYGLSIAVDRGHLVVKDGIGRNRRAGRLSRATSNLKRLVILGHSGSISFDAIRWVQDIGAALIQIDRDSDLVIAVSAGGAGIPQLRRAQAIAPWTGISQTITANLLESKLLGQSKIARDFDDFAASSIADIAKELNPTLSINDLRVFESRAASLYWSALANTPIQFARRDMERIPEQWKTLGIRMSPLTNSPRLAITPGHAVLNYLYALLEAESTVASLAIGLDPAIGLFHSDLRYRNSFSCDLMEPVRPEVDRWLIDFLANRHFAKSDFFETRKGQCRLLPPVTEQLAETCGIWRQIVGGIAENVAKSLIESAPPFPTNDGIAGQLRLPTNSAPIGRLPTPLTQSNRGAGRRAGAAKRNRKSGRGGVGPKACRECGKPIENHRRYYCDATCRESYRRATLSPKAMEGAHAKLAKLRAEGANPATTDEVLRRISKTQKKHQKAQVAWKREHDGEVFDPESFRSEVLPRLQNLRTIDLSRLTGLSTPYCALIKKGERVPHPMHWRTLRNNVPAAG